MDRPENSVLYGALETLLEVQKDLLETPSDHWEDAPNMFEALIASVQDSDTRPSGICSDLIRLLAMIKSSRASFDRVGMAQDWINHLGETLTKKAIAYGNSVGEPIRAFSKLGVKEGCLVRIDDKLSRIQSAGPGCDIDDNMLDLAGYLALLDGIEKLEDDSEAV